MAKAQDDFDIEDAEEAFDAEDFELVIDLCSALIEQNPEDVEAMHLLGEALLQIDDMPGAASVFESALEVDPHHPYLHTGMGVTRFELGEWEEAQKHLTLAWKAEPEMARAAFYLALLAERRGDDKGADKMFRAATRLDSDQYPMPVNWQVGQVVQAVRATLDHVPPAVRSWLTDLPLAIQDLPEDSVLAAHDPSLSPLLLSLFVGEGAQTDLGPRPEKVLIFRRNLGKVAQDEGELAEELARSFLYEMVHFLEMDDITARRLGIEEALFGPEGSGPDISAAIDAAEDEMGDEEEEEDSPPGESDATRGSRGNAGRTGNGRGRSIT